MEIISEKISNRKNLKHLIHSETPHQKSMASYLLLKDAYRKLDISFRHENDWRYLFIVRRHFLRKKKKEYGRHYVCHYCGKIITKIKKRHIRKQDNSYITIDHIYPTSKGGQKLDTNNMVECCHRCNEEKGNMSYKYFIQKIILKKIKKDTQVFFNYAGFCYIYSIIKNKSMNNSEKIKVINVCSLIEELFPRYWDKSLYSKIPYEETIKAINDWVSKNKAHCYGRPKESFFEWEAIEEAEAIGKNVLLEDMS